MYNTNQNIKSVPIIVILAVITCGIYPLYWMYDTGRMLAAYNNDARVSPGLDLFLTIITCGLYGIYWWYKLGNMFVESQYRADSYYITDNKILFVFLSVFSFDIVSMGIMQADLNRFWETDA